MWIKKVYILTFDQTSRVEASKTFYQMVKDMRNLRRLRGEIKEESESEEEVVTPSKDVSFILVKRVCLC
jgi:hypothetical protein